MAQPNPDDRFEQILSLEGGVDGGFPPPLLERNQTAWAVNTTHRGGWATCRPGIVKRTLTFPDTNLVVPSREGLFQGAGSYIADNGTAFIAYSISGRLFMIALDSNYAVSEFTPVGDPNSAKQKKTWFQQAERWLVVQNNRQRPVLFNGSGSRRAVQDLEVPVGGPMAFGKGRLWTARGSLVFGGDIVYGSEEFGRDNVIRFTENSFAGEGRGFSVEKGPVNGLKFITVNDEGTGEKDLCIYTKKNVHAFDAPVDRSTWANLNYPPIRYVQQDFGSVNSDAIVQVNGDQFYRSPDGLRSLYMARRDFNEWGNTPISRQVMRAMQYDTEQWLWAGSGVNFDNRALFTVQPNRVNQRGIWHGALVALDFNLVTGMGRKIPPAWEGIWTGLRILHILTVEVSENTRCFILALSSTDKLELWELTKVRPFDHDGSDDVQIPWTIEHRGVSFDNPKEFKRLMNASHWYDGVLGSVSLRGLFRADGAECWEPWASWSDCVAYRNCGETQQCATDPYTTFQPIRNYVAQKRTQISLGQPPDVPDPQNRGLTRDGYIFQLREEMVGKMRLRILEFFAQRRTDSRFGEMDNVTCDTPGTGTCFTVDCQGVECCPRDDYSYRINQSEDDGDGYPGYPDYPDDGGGGGDQEIVYDDEQLGGTPPTSECAGELIYVTSSYVWGAVPPFNPNEELSGSQIACYAAMFDKEVLATKQSYEDGGYTVSIVSSRYWMYSAAYGEQLAAIHKYTCDPNDGINDFYTLFNGYYAAVQALCIVAPPS